MRAVSKRLTESGLATSNARRRGPMLFLRSSIAACDTEPCDGGRTIGSPGACALSSNAICATESAAPRGAAAVLLRPVPLPDRAAGGAACLPDESGRDGAGGAGGGGAVTTVDDGGVTARRAALSIEGTDGIVTESATVVSPDRRTCRAATATTASNTTPPATIGTTRFFRSRMYRRGA